MDHKLSVNHRFLIVILFFSFIAIQGCAGTKTYTNSVLAGETAVVGAGWKHYFSQNNITVTFTPDDTSVSPITYLPGDTSIRGIINLYPDPLSSLVVSDQLNQNITDSSLTYSMFVKTFTGGGNEWWQTTVYLDTPPNLPVGNTTITITTPEGETASTALNVVGTGGTPDTFDGEGSGPLTRAMFESMERLDHYVIEFDGATIPEAIQVDLTGVALQGTIKNTRGDIATLHWSQTGDDYRIILTPSSQGSITDISDFRFYIPISGGATGVTTLSLSAVPTPVRAFDNNGNEISNITANITLVRGVAGLFQL